MRALAEYLRADDRTRHSDARTRAIARRRAGPPLFDPPPRPVTRCSALRAVLGAAAVALVLVMSATAAAATVSERRKVLDTDFGLLPFTYVKVAAAGDANQISVVTSEGGITVADGGAVLHGAGGCRSAADGSVFCPPLAPAAKDRGDGLDAPLVFAHVGVYLGRGDDVAAVSFHEVGADGELTGPYSDIFTVGVHGGPGNDRITLPAAAESSGYGEGGDDTVIGGENLFGGPGNDELSGIAFDGKKLAYEWFAGGAGKDVIRGGAAHTNIAVYGGAAAVHIDLRRRGGQGRAGEGDTLIDVDGAVGGAGADVLIGDRYGNALYGGAGNDAIRGGAGDDYVDGERGVDRLSGGPGDDEIAAGDGSYGGAAMPGLADEVGCGPGRDHVDDPEFVDRIARGCEIGFWLGDPTPFNTSQSLQPIASSGGALTFRAPCQGCHGSVSLTAPGSRRVVYGSWSGRFAHGRVTVPLTFTGRRALLAPGGAELRVVFTGRGSSSPLQRGYTLRVRAA